MLTPAAFHRLCLFFFSIPVSFLGLGVRYTWSARIPLLRTDVLLGFHYLHMDMNMCRQRLIRKGKRSATPDYEEPSVVGTCGNVAYDPPPRCTGTSMEQMPSRWSVDKVSKKATGDPEATICVARLNYRRRGAAVF